MSCPELKFRHDSDRTLWQARKFHKALYDVVDHVLSLAARYAIAELEVTSGYRTPEDDARLGGSGVHVAKRALDIATRKLDPKVVAEIDAHLDAAWSYDSRRPKLPVSYCAPHGSGPHMHLQVCDRTRRVL